MINTGSGPFLASITDRDGVLSQADDGISTFSLFDASIQDAPIDYIGSGTMATIGLLGLTLDSRPVTAFSVNGQIYLIAPNGLPLLSGVSITFNIDPDAPYTLSGFVPCLVEGTLVLTPDGYVPIEKLDPDCEVIDHTGMTHKVLWHGKRNAIAAGNDAPVTIPEGFFGPGVPFLPTSVSQHHRIVVFFPDLGAGLRFLRAKLLFEEGLGPDETLMQLTYHHLLFDRHIVMMANGMATESLLASTGTRKAFGEHAWESICACLNADPEAVEMQPCLPELGRGEVKHRLNYRHKLLRAR